MTSRHDLDTSWAQLGDDDDQPRQRHSGMDGREQSDFDPAKVLAEIGPRGAMADMPAQVASFDQLAERPSFHESATPAPVAAAWQAVEDAIEAAVEAERAEVALTAEQGQAQRTESARVRAAVASGRTVKLSATPGRDWDGERRHLEAVAGGHRDRARRCRVEYDAIVLQHRDGWAARIIEGLPAAREQAIKALAAAGQMVERLLADAEAAQALLLVEGGSLVALPTLPVKRFLDAMQSLAGEIESSSPLGGEGLVHAKMEPSYRDRQQIAAALLHGVVDSSARWLAALERREGYRLSSFTAGVPLPKPPEPTW